jgi:hypothetical protein
MSAAAFNAALQAAIDDGDEEAWETLALIWHRVSVALPRHNDCLGTLTYTERTDEERRLGIEPACAPVLHAELEHFGKPLALDLGRGRR